MEVPILNLAAKSQAIEGLRIQIAAALLAGLSVEAFRHALKQKEEAESTWGKDSQQAKDARQLDPNFPLTAQLAVMYTDHLLVALELRRPNPEAN